MNRLDFIACPLCGGHESIGADTAQALAAAIVEHEAGRKLDEHVRGELLNIRNVIRNTKDREEESWLDV